MALFTIDPQTCNQDGLCAAVCPPGVIDFSPGAFPVPTADAEAVCIRCGHCVAVCPTASFTHREMAPADCAPLSPQPVLSAEQKPSRSMAWNTMYLYWSVSPASTVTSL